MKYNWNNHPCVKDAVLYPEVGTLKEIGAKVVDVVETRCGWQQVITKIEGESYFWCGRMGYVHDISSNPDSPIHKTWRIICRAKSGPVRTVTTTRQ